MGTIESVQAAVAWRNKQKNTHNACKTWYVKKRGGVLTVGVLRSLRFRLVWDLWGEYAAKHLAAPRIFLDESFGWEREVADFEENPRFLGENFLTQKEKGGDFFSQTTSHFSFDLQV